MNRIQWLEWGKESFEKAKVSGKPVLLDIKGSWCHWCHVMDKTSYSDPVVIGLISKHFIPVRVDTDKRPDVNRRYNMGGWPTTAFLDSEGRIITGGTYIPPEQLRDVLRSVQDHYSKNKGKISSKLEPVRVPKGSGGPVTEKITKDIATSIAVDFDIDYGGFGIEPKFPQTDALEYAIVRYKYHGESEMLTVVKRTLEKMGRGGIYDPVEGGFYRYSTTRDWSIPHFEKMAEDNARLLAVYIRAYQVAQNGLFREIAEGIIRYVQSKLSDQEQGGFFGSQNADEEYYKLDLEGRKKRAPPSVDRTLYTNYNALMTSAFLLASVALNRPELATFALKSLDRIWEVAVRGNGLLHCSNGGSSDLGGLLADHSLMMDALMDAYEYSGNWSYVNRATALADLSLKSLFDQGGGGFYDIQVPVSEIGRLGVREKPLDENSTMAVALFRLSWLTGSDVYANAAGKTLEVFVDEYERYGIMGGSYGIALDSYLNGPIQITIVATRRAKVFEQFRLEALKTFSQRRSVLYLDPFQDGEKIEKLGYKKSQKAAYVCVGKVCGPPLTDPFQIETSLSSLLGSQPSGSGSIT